jgi:uncharacterized protein (TIGR02145 family)
MKKILIPTLFLAVGPALSAQNHLESAITNFTAKLHTISFVSDQEWTVEGNGITQIWSDAVQMTGCDSIFNGDAMFVGETSYVVFLPNCRSNPNFRGNLFSWAAVGYFGSKLCPPPWRVPTAKDFCDLNKILFDVTTCHTHKVTPEHTAAAFVNVMGGTFAGASSSRGQLSFGNVKSYYWSQTEYDAHYAYYFNIDVHGNVQPQCLSNSKAIGFSLRCVR